MNLRFAALMLAFTPAFFASCSVSNPVSPNDTEAATGSLLITAQFESAPAAAAALAKAPSTDFSSGIATLVNGTNTITVPLLISGGKALVTVSNLEAAQWSLSLKFYNATGDLTFSGSSVVLVKNGKTTPVVVTVKPVGGTVTLDLNLPIDPVGQGFVGRFISRPNGDYNFYYFSNSVLYLKQSWSLDGSNPVANYAMTVVNETNIRGIPQYGNSNDLLNFYLSADGMKIYISNGTWHERI